MNAKKPKKSRRSQNRHPALDPSLNLKTRHELIDYDYVDKLSPKEKDWLNKFTEEYINASFSKDRRKNIQRKKSQRKESYTRNNARNRDIFTKAKAMNRLSELDHIENADMERTDEDTVIEMIDKKRLVK